MTFSLVWRCTTCEGCRKFERLVLPGAISHGKRLLAHCRACGEMRILKLEGMGVPAAPDAPHRAAVIGTRMNLSRPA
ncbi:MAG: hypothetical protein ACOYN0_02330 [Phycisphaerales bacterium]